VIALLVVLASMVVVGLICLRFCDFVCPVVPLSESAPNPECEPRDGAELSALFRILSCEPSDADGILVWHTQVAALQAVCEHEPQGIDCAKLKPIYLELARRYPEFFDGHNFHTWGQSLVDLGVFRVQAKCAHITPFGRFLLDMLLAPAQRSPSTASL